MANTSEIPVVLLGQIDAGTVTTSQTYNNPNSTLSFIAPYYMNVTVNMVAAQFHYDDTTTTPYQYDFNNLEVGMWIAEQSGKAWLITDVTIVNSSQANLTIKDVNLFNVLSDPTFSGGYGSLPSGTDAAIIFNISEDGVPVIPSIYLDYSGSLGDISYWVATDVITRFQYRNVLKSHYNNSNSPNAAYINYEVGQMVYLDNTGTFQVLDASDATQVKKRFGVITSVNEPEDGDLGVRPWGKVVGDLDLSSFTVGDALYYDDLDPTNDGSYLTATEPASSAIPMYIKISDTTGMYITDMVGGGGDQIYISQVADGTPTPEDVGGIDAGTLPENIGDGTYTLSEVIDQLLWPAICPTVNGPQVTLSDNVSDLQIIGDSLSIAFTTGASGGSISGGQGVAAGDLTSATLAGAGSTNETLTITPPYDIADYTLNGYTVVSGSQSWTLTGTFAVGPMPVDNLGGDCPDVQYGGGSDTASVNFEGVYPVYAGNSTQYQGAASGTWNTTSVNTTYWTQLSLFSFNSAFFQWNQTYNEDAVAPDVVRHRFAIPSVLTVDVIKKYNSVSGNYDPIPLSQFSTTATTLEVFGNSVAYTIYEKSNSAGGASQYQVYFTD